MRLKIISDGTAWNTKVVNADTGEPLLFVKSVKWNVAAGPSNPLSECELTLIKVPVEIETAAQIELENLDGRTASVLEVGLENLDGTPFRGDTPVS